MKSTFCFYCRDTATCKDHTIPVSFVSTGKRTGSDYRRLKDFQVPSCTECNLLLGSKCFPDMAARMLYLLEKLKKRKADPARIRYLERVIELEALEALQEAA